MEIVKITTDMNYYAPQDCGATMTVGQLIDYLRRNFDDESPLYIQSIYAGASWGAINAEDIEEDYTEEYEDDEDE